MSMYLLDWHTRLWHRFSMIALWTLSHKKVVPPVSGSSAKLGFYFNSDDSLKYTWSSIPQQWWNLNFILIIYPFDGNQCPADQWNRIMCVLSSDLIPSWLGLDVTHPRLVVNWIKFNFIPLDLLDNDFPRFAYVVFLIILASASVLATSAWLSELIIQ